MNTSTEKKWFVYLSDHHEGPHSQDEVEAMLSQGRISTETYVWKEGMVDWQMMKELAEWQGDSMVTPAPAPVDFTYTEPATPVEPLEAVVDPAPETVDSAAPAAVEAVEAAIPASVEAVLPASSSNADINKDLSQVQSEKTEAFLESPSKKKSLDIPIRDQDRPNEDKSSTKKRSWSRVIAWSFAFLLLIAGFGIILSQKNAADFLESPAVRAKLDEFEEWSRPQLIRLAEKYPALWDWVSPISKLEDVSSEEFQALKEAARGPVETTGPHFAIAISTTNLFFPTFYIGSNVKDGTKFTLYLIGVGDTLLNQVEFLAQVDAVLNKSIAKTGPIRSLEGKPVPRGEYIAYLTIADNPPAELKAMIAEFQPARTKVLPELPKDVKILAAKSYFLGGSKDTVYQTHLKAFHDSLQQKVKIEISEARQFLATLESQLQATLSTFDSIKNIKNLKKQRKKWDEFHNQWMQLQGHLDQIFMKWTPEVIKKEYFYGILYKMTQDTGQAIGKVHSFQHALFIGEQDPASITAQLGTAINTAKEAIEALKTKIDGIEKLPPTPGGMPKREN